MNMYVMMSCFFQRVVIINPITGEPIQGSERGYGFLSRESDYGVTPDYRKCLFYPVDEEELIFDGWMKSGKAFAFMSGILGFVCFCVLMLACCLAFSPSMWERWLLWMYLFAAVFIALSFLSFGSDFCSQNDCKVAQGGGWAISTFLFWIICANVVKSMPHALPLDEWDEDSDDDEDWEDSKPRYRDDGGKHDPAPIEGPQYLPNDIDHPENSTTMDDGGNEMMMYPHDDVVDQYDGDIMMEEVPVENAEHTIT